MKHLVVHETVVRLRSQSLITKYDPETLNFMSQSLQNCLGLSRHLPAKRLIGLHIFLRNRRFSTFYQILSTSFYDKPWLDFKLACNHLIFEYMK